MDSSRNITLFYQPKEVEDLPLQKVSLLLFSDPRLFVTESLLLSIPSLIIAFPAAYFSSCNTRTFKSTEENRYTVRTVWPNLSAFQ